SKEIRWIAENLRSRPRRSKLQSRPQKSENRLTSDQSRRGEYARVLDPRHLCRVQSAPLREPVADRAEATAEEDRKGRLERQIHSNRDQHGAADLEHDHSDTHENADHHQRPWHIPANNSHCKGCHEPCLRRRQLPIPKSNAPCFDIRFVKEHEWEIH